MMINLTDKVEKILKEIPETRNSDIALTIEVWKRYHAGKIKVGRHGDKGIYLKDLYDLPSQESIKRIRAKFNAEWKYLPTLLGVVKVRKLNEDRWRMENGYPPRDKTQLSDKDESYTTRVIKKSKQKGGYEEVSQNSLL